MGAHTPGGSGLIGRERERDLVSAFLAGLSDGGRILHLSGVPGIGKTAVIRFAMDAAARQEVPVLSTSWVPDERGLRYAALHGLLRPRLPRRRQLPPEESSLLESVFAGYGAEPEPEHLARSALRLLALAPGPVLVCVDDFDRLDAASRDTIRHMARLCGQTQVSLIVAERAASAAWLPADALTTVLTPLPAAEARELVHRSRPSTAHAEAELVLAVAQGNPLALTELSLGGNGLRDAAGFGMLPATPSLADAYAEDLRALSAAGHGVLLTAALSTSSIVQEVLDAGVCLPGGTQAARAGLAEIAERGLVVVREHHIRFPDPLIRTAVLHSASAARRMAAHAALGQSVTDPAHAAWHTAQCVTGADEELAKRLESLAEGPWPGVGLLRALAALECAARLSADPERRAGRLLRAAELACHHGLVEQARQHARGIDPDELGDLGSAMLLWLHDLVPGNLPVGRERIAQLCSAARAVAPAHPGLAQKLLHAAAGRCWWQQAGATDRDLVVRTLKELRTPPWGTRDIAVLALTDPLSVSHLPLRTSEPPDPDQRLLLGQAAHLTGDLAQAAVFLQEAEAAARADGRHGRLPHILAARALGEIWRGAEWRTAEAMAAEGRTIATGLDHRNFAVRAVGAQGVLAALQGRHNRALQCAAEIEKASLHLGQGQHLSLAILTRVLTASGTGRYVEAYTQLRASFTELLTPYSFEQFWGLAFLVEAALPAGEADDARAVVEQIDHRTRTGRSPLLEQILDYADAVLAPDEEAENRYRAALGDGSEQWPLLYAMTQFSHGVWLRRRRRVLESRAPLTTAESVFRSLGAMPRAELAAAELRAAGLADATESRNTAAQVLSPQQLTIARLAAQGLTNRAIAERLQLSPRTVASHLYQIFPKLDVTSRAQLAEKLDPR
ncbi:AAA family ATPase [Streptomyces sp. NPDC056231]|uniref:helix-turn-helix transcriptional regulator n=1 Tax=Streptomyces sp. NPDC056231 TaxID=3345755 RepID=UPI003AAF0CBB